MSDPGRRGVRRRRSRRRRRMRRMRRALLALVLFVTVTSVAWIVSQRSPIAVWETPSAPEWSPNPSENLAILAGPGQEPLKIKRPEHPVYNYSVVPGGVHSVAELRAVTERDQTVARHYAGFRYADARVVTLQKAALVYLSYRKNGKILWTSQPHKLKAGEKLITDGKITARTKCANRISVRKQLATAPEEPTAAELDQLDPMPMFPATEMSFPAAYHSALLSTPGGSTTGGTPGSAFGVLPLFPPGGGGLAGGGGVGGGCETPAQEKQEQDFGIKDDESKEKHCPSPPPTKPPTKPPVPVPEPDTIVLLGTGLAAVYAAYRRKK